MFVKCFLTLGTGKVHIVVMITEQLEDARKQNSM